MLVTGRGNNQSFFGQNLKGAYLTEADFSNANLTEADISEAEFYKASLEGANLTRVRALGTSFREAILTGACIESWSIDNTTVFDGVVCDYLYLLYQRERRPYTGNFVPGEFTKLLQEVTNTTDLILRQGIDWKAFVDAFKKLQVENEDTELAIQSIENKGDGVVVVKVNVPLDANKEKIHADFTQNYELALRALEEKYRLLLNSKDEQINVYRQKSSDLQEIVKLLASRPTNINVESSPPYITNISSEDRKDTITMSGGTIAAGNFGIGINQEFVTKEDESDVNLQLAIKFLEKAGAKIHRKGKYSLTITECSGSLQPYVPLPVLLATEPPSADDVSELFQYSKQLAQNNQKRAGILLYLERPDPTFRTRMTEVLFSENLTIIPIPFAAVNQAFIDNASSGLLAQYADRYLPGANLFNDSNAISDALTFFGRVELINRLKEELRRNQAIGIFGLRKSGKTSLLIQLGFAMRQHPIVHIDLQNSGGRSRYGFELFNQIILYLRKRRIE